MVGLATVGPVRAPQSKRRNLLGNADGDIPLLAVENILGGTFITHGELITWVVAQQHQVRDSVFVGFCGIVLPEGITGAPVLDRTVLPIPLAGSIRRPAFLLGATLVKRIEVGKGSLVDGDVEEVVDVDFIDGDTIPVPAVIKILF